MSSGIKVHVWGGLACFTRPDMKAERLTYDCITPSAARGILEAIYWKPEIRWEITALDVLKPIQFTSLRRNEVGKKISAGTVSSVSKSGGGMLALYVEDERQQRAATILRDVAYVIHARFLIIGGESNPGKHLDQFNRRVRSGQCFHRPYLGCREFAAEFAPVDEKDPPTRDPSLDGERDLGYMLHDLDFNRGMQPHFFHAVMHDGRITVPPFGEVTR